MKKKLFLSVLLAVCFLNAYAVNRLTVAPVTVSESGTGTIEIVLENDKTYDGGFSFKLELPEGLSYVSFEKGERFVSPNEPLANAVGNTVTFVWLALTREIDHITGSNGVLLKVTVSADVSLSQGDELTAKLKEIAFATASGEDNFADVNISITIGEPDDPRTILDETSTTAPEAATGVDVRVRRTIKAGEWSTICLPFDMSEAQTKEAFGYEVQLGDFTGYKTVEDEDGNIVGISIGFDNATSIEANHPYIIKVSQDVTEFTADGVDIDPEEEPTVATVKRTKKQWSEMIGTYVPMTIESQMLFLSGNKFWYSTGLTKTKGYRAYFDFYDVLTEVENAYSSRISFSFIEETTGIRTMDRQATGDVLTYDLQGRSVKKPAKGLYLRNGKKVIMK